MGSWRDWRTGIDAGHYIPKGQGLAIRFEPHNVHCQCKQCNLNPESVDEQGRDVKTRYKAFIGFKYGHGEHDRLIRLKNKGRDKFTLAELEKMCDDYDDIIEVQEERLMTLY